MDEQLYPRIEQLYTIRSSKMEKVSWRQVKQNDKGGHLPNLRWGHSCCLIEDEVVFFGGYADSSYMNDLWSFNTITMDWTQIPTKGDIPTHRSNCTMSYDKDNDQLILFGGGGANKQRFNTINLLNWKTKEWLEINPKSNEPAPWARTYHTAELFYPYLVTYGGEGVSDLDDLWIFNFLTMAWTEVIIAKNATKPCARRFHSSARVGNEFFVIAGCHSKYRCLSDIYSIDLGSFFKTGRVDDLVWKERKMKDNTFLTRWGHTSPVYDDKIYVFGGRFCNDLNDILVLDPSKDQITTLKTYGDIPKARRRHSACFLGSSMLIFGGFNGEYFNDLHYINIPNSRKKLFANLSINEENINTLQNIKNIKWVSIKTKDGINFNVCKGLIAPRFSNEDSLDRFVDSIDEQMTEQQLQYLIKSLYKGYGKIDPQLIYQYGISIYESKEEMEHEIRKSVSQEERQSIVNIKRLRPVDPVIVLEDQLFREFLDRKRNQQNYSDVTFSLRNQAFIKSNRALLSLKSPYFNILLSEKYSENQEIIHIPFNDLILFQIVLHYLTTGFVVISKQYGHEFWVMLAEMGEYYSIGDLITICENQLLIKITQNSCQQLLVIALQMNMTQLSKACAQQIIRNMINQQKQEIGQIFPQVKSEMISINREKVLKDVYGLLRFDILQKKIDSEEKEAKDSMKSIDSANNQNLQDEKENNEIKN